MRAVIKVEDLSKSYGKIEAVKKLNITVNTGEVFGLIGANGAGKSTTIECILGTKKFDTGTVSILGLNPIRNRKELFKKVGVQFQESNYQDRITVEELCEVTYSLYESGIEYRELLKQFGLLKKQKSQVRDLSGGEKQRLFIVLALIPNPEVIFLDELTTGLDTRARRDVWKCLRNLKAKGLTILLTSHFMDEVEALCDKISIIKNGSIIFSGTVEEAIESSPCDKFEDAYLWYTEEEGNNNESI